MEYTSYFLERIDTTFNQILCQSFYIPHLSHIYPTFIPLFTPTFNAHIYPTFIPHFTPTFIPHLSHIYPTFIPHLSHIYSPRIETAALATEARRA